MQFNFPYDSYSWIEQVIYCLLFNRKAHQQTPQPYFLCQTEISDPQYPSPSDVPASFICSTTCSTTSPTSSTTSPSCSPVPPVTFFRAMSDEMAVPAPFQRRSTDNYEIFPTCTSFSPKSKNHNQGGIFFSTVQYLQKSVPFG